MKKGPPNERIAADEKTAPRASKFSGLAGGRHQSFLLVHDSSIGIYDPIGGTPGHP